MTPEKFGILYPINKPLDTKFVTNRSFLYIEDRIIYKGVNIFMDGLIEWWYYNVGPHYKNLGDVPFILRDMSFW